MFQSKPTPVYSCSAVMTHEESCWDSNPQPTGYKSSFLTSCSQLAFKLENCHLYVIYCKKSIKLDQTEEPAGVVIIQRRQLEKRQIHHS